MKTKLILILSLITLISCENADISQRASNFSTLSSTQAIVQIPDNYCEAQFGINNFQISLNTQGVENVDESMFSLVYSENAKIHKVNDATFEVLDVIEFDSEPEPTMVYNERPRQFTYYSVKVRVQTVLTELTPIDSSGIAPVKELIVRTMCKSVQ